MCHPTSQKTWFYSSLDHHLQEVTDIKGLLGAWLDVYPRLINKQLSDITSHSQTGQQTLDRYFGNLTIQDDTFGTVQIVPNREGIGYRFERRHWSSIAETDISTSSALIHRMIYLSPKPSSGMHSSKSLTKQHKSQSSFTLVLLVHCLASWGARRVASRAVPP
jgi:hypothetical protein